MQLTKEHREAILNKLQEAQEDLELQKLCLKKQNKDLIEWNEIAIFLAQKRIELILTSLIDNEIDF